MPMTIDRKLFDAAVELMKEGKSKREIAAALGRPIRTIENWARKAGHKFKHEVKYDVATRNKAVELMKEGKSKREIAAAVGRPIRTIENWACTAGHSFGRPGSRFRAESTAALHQKIADYLKHTKATAYTIADKFGLPVDHVPAVAEQMRLAGFNLAVSGAGANALYFIGGTPTGEPGRHIYTSRRGGYYKFGYTTDNHLCSKYAREDVLQDLYTWFADEGVDRVFNTGNYIDGEARFNKSDIFIHGMHNQLQYAVENYPARPGIKTYFVSGDDHEGWYGQREGVDIGRLFEQTARQAGRDDIIDIGTVESYVKLQHADIPEAWTYLLACHPGGGSAYALSYSAQKFVEALQGGEKPAVILFGHWHKLFDLLIREVICLGGGCTKDLDPFGRKNKLSYHIGGMIIELWQDNKGAIYRWRVEKKHYFDRGYYARQWSYDGVGLQRHRQELV